MGLYPPKKKNNFAREKTKKNDDLSVESVGCHIFAPTFEAPEAAEAPEAPEALLGTSRDHPRPEMTRNYMIFPLGHFGLTD